MGLGGGGEGRQLAQAHSNKSNTHVTTSFFAKCSLGGGAVIEQVYALS